MKIIFSKHVKRKIRERRVKKENVEKIRAGFHLLWSAHKKFNKHS